MRHSTRIAAAIAAASAVGLAAVSVVAADTGSARTESHNAIGLSTDGRNLSSFNLADPSGSSRIGPVKGLAGDASLIGIDQRIANRTVYGVGNAGGIYTLDLGTARATKVGQLTVALSGTDFGVDFNPAADRLRIISDTGQNLRHDVNPGGATLVDGTLAYTPGTPATGLTAAGYTNNDNVTTTATALVDLDTNLNQGALQIPANDGTLALTGPLGMDASPVAGFDIRTENRDGVSVSNKGFATLRTAGMTNSALYGVDLFSGAVSRIGFFKGVNVADLAVLHP